MVIKKFKNGKIKLQIEPKFDYNNSNEIDIDEVYHRDITMSDLYINQINGYQYVVDFNTQLVYPLISEGYHLSYYNPLVFLRNEFTKKATLYFYPESKKQSKSLLEDLDNGY